MSRRDANLDRSSTVPTAGRARIRRKLLAWYDRHRRDLPWRRRSENGYAQWVAEVMLQQTRVETVIPYYERFLERFPTLDDLAKANREQVLKLWEGLGYYRRIQHLHQAARMLHERGEPIPTSAAELRRLPGIGEYTSRAIASIAFGEPVAAVDGNVARVTARLFGVEEDVLSARGKARVRSLADQLASPTRPGDFNQAWMDLGSLICTPQAPRCEQCPLRSECHAHRTEKTDVFPLRRAAGPRAVPEVHWVTAIFVCRGRMLVRRRSMDGLWAGLWEFPSREMTDADTERTLLQELARELGLSRLDEPRQAASVRHQLTHRSFRFEVYVAKVESLTGSEAKGVIRWVNRRSFARLPVSTAHRRIFAAASTMTS